MSTTDTETDRTHHTQNNGRPEAVVCGALGCHGTNDLTAVTDSNGRTRTLCPSCRQDFLEVES